MDFYNGNEWEMNFEMKMDRLMGNKFGKRFDYNEWLKWWVRLTTSEQTLNNGE